MVGQPGHPWLCSAAVYSRVLLQEGHDGGVERPGPGQPCVGIRRIGTTANGWRTAQTSWLDESERGCAAMVFKVRSSTSRQGEASTQHWLGFRHPTHVSVYLAIVVLILARWSALALLFPLHLSFSLTCRQRALAGSLPLLLSTGRGASRPVHEVMRVLRGVAGTGIWRCVSEFRWGFRVLRPTISMPCVPGGILLEHRHGWPASVGCGGRGGVPASPRS